MLGLKLLPTELQEKQQTETKEKNLFPKEDLMEAMEVQVETLLLKQMSHWQLFKILDSKKNTKPKTAAKV